MMLHLVFWDNDTLRFPKCCFLFMVMVLVHYHPFGQKEISNIEVALWWLCLFEQNEGFEQYMFQSSSFGVFAYRKCLVSGKRGFSNLSDRDTTAVKMADKGTATYPFQARTISNLCIQYWKDPSWNFFFVQCIAYLASIQMSELYLGKSERMVKKVF